MFTLSHVTKHALLELVRLATAIVKTLIVLSVFFVLMDYDVFFIIRGFVEFLATMMTFIFTGGFSLVKTLHVSLQVKLPIKKHITNLTFEKGIFSV